ncbi:hypothetical protein [Armatimonas sp.]|uniref:hypothetical protein n=1 Tax=Armatimonas sp. TaxID=1872638 RepID=UPI00374FED5A
MPAFTYDLSTTVGKTRLFCTDTFQADYVFTDAELQVFLDTFDSSPMLAAAFALDNIAADASKIAVITKNDNQSTDPSKMPELLAARAKTLRSLAGSDPAFVAATMTAVVANAPDVIFTTDDTDTDTLGSMSGW